MLEVGKFIQTANIYRHFYENHEKAAFNFICLNFSIKLSSFYGPR